MKQLSFLPTLKISTSLEHGGSTRKGKRKIARPFDPKRPLHIVMRSSRARGEWSMLKPRHRDSIDRTLSRCALMCKIRIHRFANVGNHLHILISAPTRAALQKFLRRLTGEIAQNVTGATKLKSIGHFWDDLVYSRVVSWGREFKTVMRYLVKNLFESTGMWNRKLRPDGQLLWYDEIK